MYKEQRISWRNKKPDNYVGFLKKEEKMNMPLTQVSTTGPSD